MKDKLEWRYAIVEVDGLYSLVEMYDELNSFAEILSGFESPDEIVDTLEQMLTDLGGEYCA